MKEHWIASTHNMPRGSSSERSLVSADVFRLRRYRAIQRAHSAGLPAYYFDADLGEGIIKETPDGTRQRVRFIDGKEVAL